MGAWIRVLLVTLFALPAWGQSGFPAPEWYTPAAGAFVRIEDSDLSHLASRIPRAYQVPAIDTTGWTQFDVTRVGGTDPAGPANFTSCPNLDNRGSRDNTSALRCMLMNMGEQALLYFPNGTYDIAESPDGFAFFRPSPQFMRRGIVGQSRNAVINLIADWRDPLLFIDGEDPVYNAAATNWNGGAGATAGTTRIRVASTAGFSTTRYAPGSWVQLTANPNSVQDAATRKWFSRVVGIESGAIIIEHPLPEDFTGGGAQARAYTPAEDWVFRNLTIQFEDGNHLSPMSMMFATKGMAGLEIDNVTMRGAYRQFMIIERGADVRVHHSDFFDMTWDKATNGYGFIIAESSRVWLHDNHIQHVTGIAFSNNSQHVLVTYNDIRAPSINPRFNVSCRGNDGDGGGNDCDIDLSTHLSHGPTVGNGYLHCSTNEDDLLGYRGDASCRGTPAGAVYSCVEWHDRSASNTLFMRNYCEGPIWFDNAFGPGRNNFLYGNWLSTPVEGTPNFNTNPGDSGDFAFRDVGGALPSGYRQNAIWANNLLEGSFGVMNGYNAYGDGVRAEDNVILGSCRDADAAGHDADGGACSNDSELRGGVNGVWANNTVGAPTHGPGYSRTMPTLPGFTDWPEFSVTPEIPGPYIGPEMGNPASTTKCLPAWQRFNGGC